MRRNLFEPEHEAFRDAFRAFVDREIVPNYPDWEVTRSVPRALWASAGEAGFLCMDVPEEFGGGGVADFRFNAVIIEELGRAVASGIGFALHTDIVVPYLSRYGNDDQKSRWLSDLTRGKRVGAIAMTEPGAGSDLQGIRTTAVKEGDFYRLNGQKTFITNGIVGDWIVVVARTDPNAGHRGISLLIVDGDTDGFERGRNLEKLGQHPQDTAELFFRDVKVPVANLLGQEGMGFKYLMQNLPVERLSIAIGAVANAAAALRLTLEHCRTREAFGGKLTALQHVRFELAEMETEVTIGQCFVDRCVEELNRGELSTETASMAKWWCTDMAQRVADRGLQLFGGYGYMKEYPISRIYADNRVTRIYGGANEIMKEIVGRRLAAGDR